MEQNPYAVTEAALASAPLERASSDPFYVVSIRKCVALWIATLGLYALYWFYRNWALQREQTRESIWPLPRAVFSIFFTHALFQRVDQRLSMLGRASLWNASNTATLVVAVTLATHVLDRLTWQEIGAPFTDLVSYALVFVSALVILPAQRAINLACGDPEGATNDALTPANVVWIFIGGLIWLLSAFLIAAPLFGIDLDE
jgi:hypothetical protein